MPSKRKKSTNKVRSNQGTKDKLTESKEGKQIISKLTTPLNVNSNATETPTSILSEPNLTDDEKKVIEEFNLELKWCLQQLEHDLDLCNKDTNSKKFDLLSKGYKTLSKPNNPMVKKRLVMRSMFGDFREKMAQEAKKFVIKNPQIKPQAAPPKTSKVVKKAVFKSNNSSLSSKLTNLKINDKNDTEVFRFNFQENS